MKLESSKAGSGGLSPLPYPARATGSRFLKEFSTEQSGTWRLEPLRDAVGDPHLPCPLPAPFPAAPGWGRGPPERGRGCVHTWKVLGREAQPRGAGQKLEREQGR